MRPPSLLTLLLLAASALPADSFTPIFGSPEPAVATTLDTVYGAGGYTRVSDDLDQFWQGDAILSVVAISSYAGATQAFGLCQICDGSDDTLFAPSITADGISMQPLTAFAQSTLSLGPGLFRFFNDPSGVAQVGRVYSDPTLNPLQGDHMVTFSINGQPNVYALAFEDWLFTSDPESDRDYNDLVVQVSFLRNDIQTTPEPASALLLGGGLLLIARLARRRQAS
ncbi:MAG: DUF4114 domain-containing protein [Acidobacteria bacterium]|nr:DUF4114 domain-containing protein [Acidobacteriota bacterium]